MTALTDHERPAAYAAAYAERWGDVLTTPPPTGAPAPDQSTRNPPQEPR